MSNKELPISKNEGNTGWDGLGARDRGAREKSLRVEEKSTLHSSLFTLHSRLTVLRPSTFLARYSTFSSLDHRATNTKPINSDVHHATLTLGYVVSPLHGI